MIQTGFEKYSDKTLIFVQIRLLEGVNEVAESLSNGSFREVGPKGEASPSESGQTSLAFLKMVSLELAIRGLDSVAVDLDSIIRETGENDE